MRSLCSNGKVCPLTSSAKIMRTDDKAVGKATMIGADAWNCSKKASRWGCRSIMRSERDVLWITMNCEVGPVSSKYFLSSIATAHSLLYISRVFGHLCTQTLRPGQRVWEQNAARCVLLICNELEHVGDTQHLRISCHKMCHPVCFNGAKFVVCTEIFIFFTWFRLTWEAMLTHTRLWFTAIRWLIRVNTPHKKVWQTKTAKMMWKFANCRQSDQTTYGFPTQTTLLYCSTMNTQTKAVN